MFFFFSSRRRHTRCALVTGVQTCALPISMAAHGSRRLLAMADNLGHVIGIELLAAAQGCDFHAPLTSSAALEAARALIRAEVPMMHDDHHFAPDIAKIGRAHV